MSTGKTTQRTGKFFLPPKVKKIIRIAVDVLLWLFLAFALFVTILSISATSAEEKVPSIGGKIFFSVRSDSMKPVFEAGDLIIGKKLTEEELPRLREGDIITYYDESIPIDHAYQKTALNTHRIIGAPQIENGRLVSVMTQGDNREMSVTPSVVQAGHIVAVYRGEDFAYQGARYRGVGAALNFLQSPAGFLLCIVLPLLLFFLYEIVVVTRIVLGIRNKGKKVITEQDEELIKQRAIEEYLKAQKEREGGGPAQVPPPDERDDSPADEK